LFSPIVLLTLKGTSPKSKELSIMPAGYSGTPLIKKLGLKAGQKAIFLKTPKGYDKTLGPLPAGLDLNKRFSPPFDFIHFFCDRRKDLQREFPRLRDGLTTAGMLWVSWPKKSSGVSTDVDEGLVRETGLSAGLVDVKICAVDEIWSGLKFVRRLKDR
jgi:hypothetical protein